MGFYEDRIQPRLLDSTLGTPEASGYRAMATAGLRGTVVEIGFGSGGNLAHYPPAVDRVYAIEPSARARELARPRIEAASVPVDLLGLRGEDLPLDDGVADAVLTTWTLCAIADLDGALAEMRRVLRPGGRLHFVEHGLHPDPKVQRWQRRLNPVQKLVFGCRLDRPIDRLLTAAGFEIDALANPRMRAPATHGYLYQGRATRPVAADL